MACHRRTVCSTKSLTGLFCGIVMGFVMGTIHLAIMKSEFVYTPNDGMNPCIHDQLRHAERNVGGDVDLRQDAAKQLDAGLNLVHKDKRFREPTFDDSLELNNEIYDYNGYDHGEEDTDTFLRDVEIDKIYEIDISKMRKSKGSNPIAFSEVHSPHKIIPQRQNKRPVEFQSKSLQSEDRKFLYVGVMTAGKYVHTRGKAIMDTWAPKVPGKAELFVGEDAVLNGIEDEAVMNVVRLKKVVDDLYPPQKKSFMMLRYMYEQYLNGFEWFMRADDDAYVKTDKLEQLLRKLNSSEPIFMGQTGLGNQEERGKLTLDYGENYCMGGPGMIFSREVIRRMAPHIGKCLRNMYTNHEDVEVSRCVNKYANVNCVWSYEMRELFYEHYTKRLGYIDPQDGGFGNGLLNAITLHPNKKPEYQRKLHRFFLSQKIKELQTKLSKLHRDLVEANEALDRTSEMEELMLGSPLNLNRFRPTNGSEILAWNFFSDHVHFVMGDSPSRSIPTYSQVALKDMVLQILRTMNSNSKSRGRVISFKRVNYGYVRVNPLFGSEYVLDLLLHYNRYRGKKVSLPVRRHAYLQQTFARTVLREDPSVDIARLVHKALSQTRPSVMDAIASKFLRRPVKALASLLGFDGGKFYGFHRGISSQNNDAGEYHTFKLDPKHLNTRFMDSDLKPKLPTVNIIVPLTGRFSTFQRFMANLERVALSKGDPISVLIMLFMPQDAKEREKMRLTQQLIQDYQSRYPGSEIRFLPIGGEFSRGLALEVGASQFAENALMFFCDVDVIFNANFLRKCRTNTVRGETVYYPVLFSEFDPTHRDSEESMHSERQNHFEINQDSGYWRGFGYGLLCVYQSDFNSAGGFDTSIKGWGLEDVDLFGKFVKRETEEDSEKPRKSATAIPMRVRDPDLIHVFHPSKCSPDLNTKQLTMCRSSRSSGIMSVSRLYRKWRETNDRYVVDDDAPDQPIGHQSDIQNFHGKGKYFYGRVDDSR